MLSTNQVRTLRRSSLKRLGSLTLILGFWTASPDVLGEDWPQWRGPKRDGVWRETGIVEQLPSKLSFMWRTPIGEGYAGPAVVGNRVYLTDLVPGDESSKAKATERVLCLDSESGKIVWKYEYPISYTFSYPEGPRTTPTVHSGKVYSLGAMGNLFCLDAATGKHLWSRSYPKDYGAEVPVWGFSSAPLVDGRKLILIAGGSNNRCVLALDKDTGTTIWQALTAQEPGYSAPVIFETGGKRQLIIWNPSGLYGLDPETGERYWGQEFPIRNGLCLATPIFDLKRRLLFVSAFYNGPLMMRPDAHQPSASLLWKGKSESEIETDGLHSLMCTPVLQEGYIYGIDSYGELRCLNAKTGERIWTTLDATGKDRWWNAFLIKHEDRFFICNEQGELIIAQLSPQGYRETSRAFLIEPTNPIRRRMVVWSHPAFARKSVFARNSKEIVRVDLSANR